MSPLKPFEASRLKLARAKIHIEEFRAQSMAFLESDPVAVVVEEQPTLTYIDNYAFIARVKRTVPHEISTVVGDAIHNLRTSLDVLACDLVRMNSQSADNVYFPFAKNAGELEEQIKAKRLTRASADAQKLVRSMKPYTGGNAQLRALHDLDIRDKHQALLPSLNAVELPAFGLKLGNHVNPIPAFSSGIVKDGQILMMLPRSDNLPAGSRVPVKIGLVWELDTPFPGESILASLERLAELVESIIEAARALYPGDQDYPIPTTPKKNPLVRGLILAREGAMKHVPVRR